MSGKRRMPFKIKRYTVLDVKKKINPFLLIDKNNSNAMSYYRENKYKSDGDSYRQFHYVTGD